MLGVLNAGEMPPEDEPQPSDEERDAMITFVSTMLVPVVYVLLETMRELVVDVEQEVKNREMI